MQYAIEQRLAAQEAGVYRSDVMVPSSLDVTGAVSGGGSGDGAAPAAAAGSLGFVIQPPEFVGGEPSVVDKATGKPFGTSAEQGAFHALERLVDHSCNIKSVLQECIAYEEKAFAARKQTLLARYGRGATSPRAGSKKTASAAGAAAAAAAADGAASPADLAATAAAVTALFDGPLGSCSRSLARKWCVLGEECFQSADHEGALRLFKQVLPIYEDAPGGGGQWSALSRFVLERLQETARRCGDHTTFVDASLRLLALFPDTRKPALGEAVLAALAAHRNGAGAGASGGGGGTRLLQVPIHPVRTAGLFSLACGFDRPAASHNDTVNVAVTLVSHFPVPLRLQGLRAGFSSAQYDCGLRLGDGGGGGGGGGGDSGLLDLAVDTPVSAECAVTINQSNSSGSVSSTKATNLRLACVTATLVDSTGAPLCMLTVPVDDDGTSSIAATKAAEETAAAQGQLARRLAADTGAVSADTTSSSSSSSLTADHGPGSVNSTAAATTRLSSRERWRRRHHWLAIEPPVARATLRVSGDAATLYGAAHCYRIDMTATADACRGTTLSLHFEDLRKADHDLHVRVIGVSVPINVVASQVTGSGGADDQAAPAAAAKRGAGSGGAAAGAAAVGAGGAGGAASTAAAFDAAWAAAVSRKESVAASPAADAPPVGPGSELQLAPESRVERLAVDGATGRAAALALPDLAPGQGCSVVLHITTCAVQQFRLAAALQYTNAKDCQVATVPEWFAWRCVNPVEVEHFVDYLQPNVWCVCRCCC